MSENVVSNDDRVPRLRYMLVADSLRTRILEGVYLPGERLLRQHDLAAEYNVAFTTLKRALDVLEEEGYLVRKVGQGTYAALPEKRTPTALVVDDDGNVRELLARILADSSCDAVLVESGEMAGEKVKEQQFDVIFLDLIMPRMNGADTFREIHKVDPKSYVVIITAYPNSDLMWEALEIGPFAVMKKPIVPDQVRMILADVATRRDIPPRPSQ